MALLESEPREKDLLPPSSGLHTGALPSGPALSGARTNRQHSLPRRLGMQGAGQQPEGPGHNGRPAYNVPPFQTVLVP